MSVIIGDPKDRTVDGALRALAGEPTSLTPGAALGLLADYAAGAREPTDRAKATSGLVKALAGHADNQVRAGAAAALAAAPTPAALRALRAAVDSSDDGEVLGAASMALARTGTKNDVKRLLDGSRRAQWEPGQRRAAAAARLLAHRTGTAFKADGTAARLGADGEVLGRPVRGTAIRAIDVADVAGRVKVKAAEANLVPPAAKAVGAFSCGARQHIVMAPTTRKHLAELATTPAIAATLMGVNESTGAAFVRWIVLTRPATADDGAGRGADGDLVVTVTRSTGEVGFVGRGRVEGDSLTVELAAIAAPGASAVDLTGTLAGGKVTITGVSDDKVTVDRMVPAAAPITNPTR
ncbi:MAG: HEAT repeat domain-containing protein [Actinomycetota bacterium]|nr:HEAT repeat domain-containing protein [Actinomycetota bacterium]